MVIDIVCYLTVRTAKMFGNHQYGNRKVWLSTRPVFENTVVECSSVLDYVWLSICLASEWTVVEA